MRSMMFGPHFCFIAKCECANTPRELLRLTTQPSSVGRGARKPSNLVSDAVQQDDQVVSVAVQEILRYRCNRLESKKKRTPTVLPKYCKYKPSVTKCWSLRSFFLSNSIVKAFRICLGDFFTLPTGKKVIEYRLLNVFERSNCLLG